MMNGAPKSEKSGSDRREERKANRRGAARLAAVQALYQMDIAGTDLNDILAAAFGSSTLALLSLSPPGWGAASPGS